jgi:hypothetical protein
MADGGGQRSSGEVVERGKEQECGEVYWVRSQAKKRHAGGRQAAADGRWHAWRLRRAAARRVCARRSQRGRLSGGRASWGPGGAGRAAKGQLAVRENTGDGRRCREIERGKQVEEDEDLFVNFAKVQGVHCKVKFPSKL